MDGTPTLRMTDFVLQSLNAKKISAGSPGDLSKLPAPKHLTWTLNDTIKSAIRTAEQTFDKTVAAHDVTVLQVKSIGKEQIKHFKVSPDAFVQLAIQLAYYRMFGRQVATYESCQTRSFLHGRTEVIRSCTSASGALCRVMTDSASSPESRYRALQAAANAHVAYAADASIGRGVDRHFSGLKMVRKEGEKYGIFEDPSFSRANHWQLSTSMLSSELFEAWGFGEVVPDGFGVGYMVNNNQINFVITSLRLGSDKLASLIQQSIHDLATVCVAVNKLPAKL